MSTEEKVDLFAYLNDITANKTGLAYRDDEFERNYLPYMICKGLSKNVGDVLWANYLNINPGSFTKRMHHDFLFNILSRGRRTGKWVKDSVVEDEDIEAVMSYYKMSRREVEMVIHLMSAEEIDRAKNVIGGKEKKS